MITKKFLLPTIASLLIVSTSGCIKSADAENSSLTSSAGSSATSRKHLLPVDLGTSSNYTILSKSGIASVYRSFIAGNVGASPASSAAIILACAEVSGTIYSVDGGSELQCLVPNAEGLSGAVTDMQTAYADAAGRLNPDYINLGNGDIGGRTLAPGLYKWTSSVVVPTNVKISGGANDVWIFQIDGNLSFNELTRITLGGAAKAKNIFWQTSGAVTLGTTSHFEGIILSHTAINMQTGASINGRLLAQTAVTLQMNTVVKPN